MLKAEGKCPHCGLPITDKVGEKEKHDWIIRICCRCGQKYADDRYFEPALFQYTPKKMMEGKVSTGWSALVIGLVVLVGAIVAEWASFETPVTFKKLIILGACLSLFGACTLISTLFSTEKEKYDILYGESLLRLQNPQYVQDLMDAGYEIPEDVLDDLRYVK